MKAMDIKTAILIALIGLGGNIIYAQDSVAVKEEKPKEKPVRTPFENALLINNQTFVVPQANTLEFIMQHRFGKLNSESFDLVGLYAPSNIRMGLAFSLTDNIVVGLGTTKSNKLQDINWKWNILDQTRSGSMPIALTYYGNTVYDARSEDNFGIEYKSAHRVAYFHQLIVGRKFHRLVTVQVAGSYSHYNQVDTIAYPEMVHDNMAISISGRVKFSAQGGINFEYDMPLTTSDLIKPNASLGVEFATTSHVFQIFVGTYDMIIQQRNQVYNVNDFTANDLLLGFNITRSWNL